MLFLDVADGLTSQRSPEYLRLHGLSPGSAHENHWLSRVHPEDRDRADAALHSALAGPGNPYESEYWIIRPDNGQIRWIKAQADIPGGPELRESRS